MNRAEPHEERQDEDNAAGPLEPGAAAMHQDGQEAVDGAEGSHLVYIVADPFIPCACLICGGQCLTLARLGKHMRFVHLETEVSYKCRQCEKMFAKAHGAAVHCRGCGRRPPADLPFTCLLCNKKFKSALSVSQHERHTHPEAAQERRKLRIANENERKRLRRREAGEGDRRARWTEEEIEIILNFERERGVGGLYMLHLGPLLPGRTARQIRDKIKDLRRSRKIPARPFQRRDDQEDTGEEEGDPDDPGPGPAGDPGDPEDSSGEEDADEGEDPLLGWTEDPRTYWIGTDQTHPLAVLLRDEWTAREELPAEWIDAFCVRLVESLRAEHGNQPAGRPRVRRGRNNRTSDRRRRFANAQAMYEKCPSRLAELVRLNNVGNLLGDDIPAPPQADIRRVYQQLWGQQGICGAVFPRVKDQELLTPVSAEDVRRRIKKMKPGGAPGPDGLKKINLVGVQGLFGLLAGLFNLLLRQGYYPDPWRDNTTSMIPKEGKDLSTAGGWRPITLGNVLARLFSGVMEAKTRPLVKLAIRQKGFVEGPGIFANIRTLHEAIKMGKRSELAAAVLDVAQAFDSVPHMAIWAAMEAMGIPPP